MSYTNSTQVEIALAQAIVTASPGDLTTPRKLVDLGTTNVNTVPPEEFNFFIAQADAIIDAALSQQYAVPLSEKCDLQMTLTAEVSEYSDTFSVANYRNLSVGDNLVITDGTNEERLTVLTLETNTTFQVEMMPTNSYAFGTRLIRVKFPEPISYIAARLAAAMIYDKHLKAQTDPAKSDYGDLLRKNAISDLNNIREGRTIIDAPRIGWRFANPNLVSRYTVKGMVESDSTYPGAKRIMEDYFKEIKALVDKLEQYDGKPIVVDNIQVAGTTANKMELPLSKRLAATNEEAMNRARLEANKRNDQLEDDGSEHDDEVSELYADEIIDKFLRGVGF